MDPFFHTGLSISDSLKTVRKSVLIYETIIVGVALTCSLLTVLGSVSNDGIMPCGECIINEQTKN